MERLTMRNSYGSISQPTHSTLEDIDDVIAKIKELSR